MPRYLSDCVFVGNCYIVNGDLCAGLFSQRKVTCVDFFSLILKPHLWNHFSIESRPRWRVDEAIIGLACDVNSAVSSANVAKIILVNQLILVNRQCRWRTEGIRGHYLGVCLLLLGKLW